MPLPDPLEIFCSCPPGLEPLLCAEAQAGGFADAQPAPGGVRFAGDWAAVMRANLWLRGAGRVLVRIAAFRAPHLAQLDKRARKLDWTGLFGADSSLRIEASCRKSRIYHAKAASQRVAGAITDATGAQVSAEGALRVLVRIEDDLCTISLDSSGAPLHRRGHKHAVGKAPMRETLAALFLRACDFDGVEPVADPMCGSGTFVIEAAEIAAGLAPGRARSFAFEALAGHDRGAWEAMRADAVTTGAQPDWQGFGSDRDNGAIRMATENAARAGVQDRLHFTRRAISDFAPPEGPPGLIMVNPPYGARIGERKLLFALYGRLGEVLRASCPGWRVGLITSDPGLARATALPFLPTGPAISHGGLKITLYRTAPLG